MEIKTFLEKSFIYKDDLQRYAEHLEIPATGTKAKLIESMLADRKFKFKEFLGILSKDSLKFVCSGLNLLVGGNKDELIDRICKEVKANPPQKPKVKSPKEFENVTSINPRPKKQLEEQKLTQAEDVEGEFERLLEIVKKWSPKIRYKDESGYRAELDGMLHHREGFETRIEFGESLIDIEVKGKFKKYPIEIKKSPNHSEYNRLLGQTIRHLRAYGLIIVIICEEKRQQNFDEYMSCINEFFPDRKIYVFQK